jgi:hypothetical protein
VKLYEAWYCVIIKKDCEGLTWSMDLITGQMLENTSDYSFLKNGKQFTPNYPTELVSNIIRHQHYIKF